MANNQQIISRTEGNLLFCFTLAGFLLRVINYLNVTVFAPPPDGPSFGTYDIFDMKEMMSPIYSSLAFLICTPLAWKINTVTSMLTLFPLFLLTLFFDWWFFTTRQTIAYAAIANPDFKFKTLDVVLLDGSLYDVITLVLVNILIIWQVSILFRLRKGLI